MLVSMFLFPQIELKTTVEVLKELSFHSPSAQVLHTPAGGWENIQV